MKHTFILITDAHRARCFERNTQTHALTELADFIYPHATLGNTEGAGDLTGAAGKGHGRTAQAGTQFEPHTEVHAKERHSFAVQLADYLNKAVSTQQWEALVLIATAPMLGELKPCLSAAATKVLQRCIASDLTHYQGPELKQRVELALQLPD